MRVAYFVQSHCQPAQVQRLLGRLRAGSPDSVLVVGHCPAALPLDEGELRRLGALHFLHRRRASRGYWSLVEPYLDAVALLGERGIDYDWLVYLSGADYPLRPVAAIEADLAASSYDGYITWQRADGRAPDGRRKQGIVRYRYRYVDLPRVPTLLRMLRPLNNVQSFFHVHLSYGPRLGRRCGTFRAPGERAVYRGAQWTTLRRACAERLLAVAREEPALVEWFEHTVCPDEAFAQTVLVADPQFRLRNDSRRFVHGQCDRSGHPGTLTTADLGDLLDSGCDFGRKVDPDVDTALLDALDRQAEAGSSAGPAAAPRTGRVPSRQ